MPILLLLLALPLVLIALMPLILIQRYRMGTARRMARPWMATLNLVLMVFSVFCFLAAAALTAVWVPNALRGAAAGLVVGTGLGLVGLVLTRWEPTAATLHYTPNRWLVLIVTFMVSARVLYGLWRSWKAAEAGVYGTRDGAGVRDSRVAGRRRRGDWLLHRLRVGSAAPRPPVAAAPVARDVTQRYAPPLITTRRFWARPARVVFGAAGLFSP